ncbi:MAG: hypothetical protein Fur0044_12810 [Anaerolineae bacterium]|nr:hypothetical protein [Anaerolineales bacterium]MCQ3978534.1 hypothetical protein [Anaerolineae bacterium]
MDLATVLWLHKGVGNAAPLFMVLVSLISFINYFRGLGLDGNVIGAVVVGEIMMLTQASLGLILLVLGLWPGGWGIHFLYGSLSVLFFPALWAYTRGATDRRASLTWAVGGLFMMGLTLRAIGTAG